LPGEIGKIKNRVEDAALPVPVIVYCNEREAVYGVAQKPKALNYISAIAKYFFSCRL
jgi:hypothetical protein